MRFGERGEIHTVKTLEDCFKGGKLGQKIEDMTTVMRNRNETKLLEEGTVNKQITFLFVRNNPNAKTETIIKRTTKRCSTG